jgi:hypothetical protein
MPNSLPDMGLSMPTEWLLFKITKTPLASRGMSGAE